MEMLVQNTTHTSEQKSWASYSRHSESLFNIQKHKNDHKLDDYHHSSNMAETFEYSYSRQQQQIISETQSLFRGHHKSGVTALRN